MRRDPFICTTGTISPGFQRFPEISHMPPRGSHLHQDGVHAVEIVLRPPQLHSLEVEVGRELVKDVQGDLTEGLLKALATGGSLAALWVVREKTSA